LTPSEDLPKELRLFRNFLRLAWRHLNLPEPTKVQLEIADFLQFGPKRSVIEAFRGVGKSWITSAYVCWSLLLDPQLNFLVVSASKDRSDNFTTFTLRLIRTMPILAHLAPTPDQRESKIAFDVSPAEPDHNPSVKSVGIFGQLAGSRANVIVADDVEVPNTAGTQTMREKLSEAVKEFDAILKPGDETKIVFLGTPQTEESLYNRLPQRGYSIRIWPARYPSQKQVGLYGDRLAPRLIEEASKEDLGGRSTDPMRFSEVDLIERESSYGRSGFALQFMLDTRLSDANRYPLKISDLVVMDVDPDMGPEKVLWASDAPNVLNDLHNVAFSGDRWHRPMGYATDHLGQPRLRPYEGTIMAIDPSGRGKDETGYAVVKLLNSQLFLVACGGFRNGYEDSTLMGLAEIAKRHKANKIIVEPNFGDGMFNRLLQPVLGRVYPCTVEDAERSNSQKERRIIDTLEPVINQHRLIVDRKVIQRDYESVKDLPEEEALVYQLFYQMTRITKDKGSLSRDDRLDAVALAVGHWVEVMNIDIDRRIKQNKAEALDKELARFMEHATGQSRQPEKTWMTQWR
jgi:hypothetical protein